MLKNIPGILSPELLKALDEMGHGDTVVIGDGNFPGAGVARVGHALYLRADGHGVPELLDAILTVIPTDAYVEFPLRLMQKMDCDAELPIPIWETYKEVAARHEEGAADKFGFYERFEFYEQAKKAYCIVQTGEKSVYANVIIQKGVIA
ncbi:MAG: fucose isomerase [Firmicutes bacterium]|nr:fucose isomerase [Bacillota bacterium]